MLKRRLFGVAAVLALAGASHAITPDQVGFYTGKLKLTYNELGFKSKLKGILFLELKADGTTVVTIDGVTQSQGSSIIGPTEGVLAWADTTVTDIQDVCISTAHLKNGSIKGKVSGATLNTDTETLIRNAQGTIKLKKL